ncbi:MAG TPA: hypothetical protein VEY30_09660, partial [Myxococcaceae bacterium]|nr:hypothetical protein [Myxococcaceae bacterium]
LHALAAVSAVGLFGCGADSTAVVSASEAAETASKAQVSSTDLSFERSVIVDNSDPGFSLQLDSGYHQFERSTEDWTQTACTEERQGIGADFVTAPSGYQRGYGESPIDGAKMAALAVWASPLEAGTYAVYTYVVPSKDNTRYATFCVDSEGAGSLKCGLVDQSTGAEGWREIATLSVAGSTRVWLDPAATVDGNKRVVADAVAFVPVGSAP